MLLDQERVLVAQVKPSDHGFVCNLCFSRFTKYYPGRFYDHTSECVGPQPSERDRMVFTSGRLSIYKVEPTSTLWAHLKKMAEVSRMQKIDTFDYEDSISENYGNTFAAMLDDLRLIGYLSLRPLISSASTVIDWFIHPAMDQHEVFKQFVEAASRDRYNTKEIQADAASLTQRFADPDTVSDDLGRILSPTETADTVMLHPFFELAMWDNCTQRSQRRRLLSRRKYLDKDARDKEFDLERQSFHDNWWKLFEQHQSPPCLDKVELSELAIAELRMHQDMMMETIQRLTSPETAVSEVQRVLVYARKVEAHPLVIADLEEIVRGKTESPPELAVRVEPTAHTFISYGHDLHHDVAESVRGWLIEAGIAVWIDKESLEPVAGEQLDPAIAAAINTSSVVCVCVSLDMAERDRYLQREIRHLMTLAESVYSSPGIVLVCCDESPPPKALQDVSTAVVSFPPTQSKVIAAVRRSQTDKMQRRQETSRLKEAGHTPAVVREREDARNARNIALEKNASVLHEDIYSSLIQTRDEAKFLRYLIDNWKESAKLLTVEDYDAVVARWAPVCRDELFSLRLPRWLGRPAVRILMLNAKTDLLAANLAGGGGTARFEAAFRELFDIAGCPAFSMAGSSSETLPDTEARHGNIMLLDCFHIANQLRESQDIVGIAALAGCSKKEAYEFFHQIDRRTAEIQSFQLGLEEFT